MVDRRDLFDVKKRSYKELQQISGDKIWPGGGCYGSCLGEIDANCTAGVCLDAPRPHTCCPRPPVMSLSLTARRAPHALPHPAAETASGFRCSLQAWLQSQCRHILAALLPRNPPTPALCKTRPREMRGNTLYRTPGTGYTKINPIIFFTCASLQDWFPCR
ncbi:hypothetical protein E2C01_013689 [Portunus trituberculatus]|uniref:Uncharacterized protein n=1 Tax=Portunus trituberculatus TaxID=210409 RepID=A0A5B7DHP7_PORTR|nr:hypothetical protein [Portunus trituberculatus]